MWNTLTIMSRGELPEQNVQYGEKQNETRKIQIHLYACMYHVHT